MLYVCVTGRHVGVLELENGFAPSNGYCFNKCVANVASSIQIK